MKKVLISLLLLIIIILLLLVLGRKQISTNIIIQAPVHKVWAVLADFTAYPAWNPFILKIDGEIKTGNSIEVTLRIPGGKPMVFTPEVLAYEKNHLLQWEGRLFLPGIFTGKHTFRLERIDNARTRFFQEEDFRGVLVPFFNLDSTESGFSSMNLELKKRAERGAIASGKSY